MNSGNVAVNERRHEHPGLTAYDVACGTATSITQPAA